jgi:hypothetical protein
MNTSLYVLASEYHASASKLLESDFDEQTIADTLEGLSGELEFKATNVAMLVRNLEASAEQIKIAEKSMADRRKAIESKAESIKRYLKDNMQRSGITKIESPYFALTIKKNPPSVIIDDATAIPAKFMVTPPAPPPSPDKTAIKAALQAGELVDGAHIEQGERLEIK